MVRRVFSRVIPLFVTSQVNLAVICGSCPVNSNENVTEAGSFRQMIMLPRMSAPCIGHHKASYPV